MYTDGDHQGYSYGFFLSRTIGYLTVDKGSDTVLTGISTNGSIVGHYTSGDITGFVQTATGQFRVLPNLNGFPVQPLGINSANVIVGSDEVRGDGFILDPTGETYRIVDYPGASVTGLLGINNTGVAVGVYTKYVNGNGESGGFVYSNGEITDFSYQGNPTSPSGINADGVIVGSYNDASGQIHGFIATPAQ